MSHNARIYTQGLLTTKFVPTPRFLRQLDLDTSQSVNGDDGGLWAPTKPIIVGGSGVAISTAGGFTGGVRTGSRAAAGALRLGDNDWPTFAARTRSVVFPIIDDLWAFADVNQETASNTYDQATPGSFKASSTALFTQNLLDRKKLPVGATIDSVTLRFRVGLKPTAVPGTLPRLYFVSDALVDDAFLPAPGTAAVYYNDGLPQSLQIIPVNNVSVVAGQNYVAQIVDGSLTSNIFHSITIAFSNIVDMRPGL